MTPLQIQRRLIRLVRELRDVTFLYTVARLSGNQAEIRLLCDTAHDIRVEILRLKQEYETTIQTRAAQAALEQAQQEAVAEAERILEIHWQQINGRSKSG